MRAGLLGIILLIAPLFAGAQTTNSFPDLIDILVVNETNSAGLYVDLEAHDSLKAMQETLDGISRNRKLKGAMLRFDPQKTEVTSLCDTAKAVYHCGVPVIFLLDISILNIGPEFSNNPYVFAIKRMPRYNHLLRILDLNELLHMPGEGHNSSHPPLPTAASPIVTTVFIVLFAAGSYFAGLRISRLKKPWWLLGYIIPVIITSVIAVARWFPTLEMHAPFCWLMRERREYVIMAIATALLLAVPVARLKRKTTAILATSFAALFVLHFSVLPFLLPALNRNELLHLQTSFDRYGTCMQNTGYTCGPAAAVSALAEFDIHAEEGELAVFAHSTPSAGTPPELLSRAITDLYAAQGIGCEFRSFRETGEMKDILPVIAVVRFGFLVDHYVTVVRVTDTYISVADPAKGLRIMTHKDFTSEWRKQGIVVSRN